MSDRKIRITIEIEDEQVTSTTVEQMSGAQQPPRELAQAAAAVGALSAGPAPAQPGTEVSPAEETADAGAAPCHEC
jgi:hypothetical protein